MGRHQRHHHDCERAGRAGNHARPAADQRGHQADNEGRIEPHQRVHMRHEGKGDRLRHEGQRHGQAGQKVGLDLAGRVGLEIGL
jgi:hypothetical protein